MPEIDVGEVTLGYVEKGEGPPVVFVHGGSGDYRVWDDLLPVFAAEFRAVAVSCRGYWPNKKLEADEELTLDTFVGDLVNYLQALDAGAVHLVGHSSPGGFGSLRLAQSHPELLRTLVLVEPPAFTLLGVNIPPTPGQLLRLLLRNPHAALGFVKFGARGMGPAIKAFERGDDEGALRTFMAANTSKDVVATMSSERFQRAVENVGPLKAQIRAGFPDFSEQDVRAVRVPTLLVSGEKSPGHVTAVTERLEQLLPDVERINIAQATHNMFESHPDEFCRGVMEFIRRR